MTSYAASTARAEMGELRRLKTLLPPELQSWVTIEVATAVNPTLITSEEIGRDEVEIQIDMPKWDQLALDQRNLLFWHEVGRVQADTIPRDGWEMAALAIGFRVRSRCHHDSRLSRPAYTADERSQSV